MAKKKQFFNEINIMRGIAVLLVVIGHSFDATETPTVLGFLKSFVYCFHMPAFFFISGFFVKDRPMDWNTKVSKILGKARRLMIPYLFLTLVTIGLKVVFGMFARNPLNYSTLVVDVLIGRNNPNGGLWFLYGLFVVSAIGILINEVDKRIVFAGTFALYLLNTFVFHQSGYILSFFMDYAWYFFGGTLIRKYAYDGIKNACANFTIKGKVTTVVVTVLFMALAFVRIYMVDVWMLSCIVTVLGVILLLVIAIQLDAVKKGRQFWMLLGDYGMDIYMIGYYVQQAVYVVIGRLLGLDYLLYAWAMCILGLAGPILISKYIVRKNRILSLLVLGR